LFNPFTVYCEHASTIHDIGIDVIAKTVVLLLHFDVFYMSELIFIKKVLLFVTPKKKHLTHLFI